MRNHISIQSDSKMMKMTNYYLFPFLMFVPKIGVFSLGF